MADTFNVWKIDDGGERFWVIAADAVDALRVMVECQMADYPDIDAYRRECEPEVELVAGTHELAINDDGPIIRKTAAEWVASEGRGYLAGTVW